MGLWKSLGRELRGPSSRVSSRPPPCSRPLSTPSSHSALAAEQPGPSLPEPPLHPPSPHMQTLQNAPPGREGESLAHWFPVPLNCCPGQLGIYSCLGKKLATTHLRRSLPSTERQEPQSQGTCSLPQGTAWEASEVPAASVDLDRLTA